MSAAAVSPPAAVDTPTTIPAPTEATTIPAPTEATTIPAPTEATTIPTPTEATTIPAPTEATEASHSKFDHTPIKQEETQSSDDIAFKKKQEEEKKKIYDRIEQIYSKADKKNEELSKLYNVAESNYNHDPTEDNYKKLEKISASIDAVYDEKSEALDKIQKGLDGDTTPILVAGTKSLVNYGFNFIKAKFMKSQLEAQALKVAESTMDILVEKSDEMDANIKNGEDVNIDNMAKLTHLANDVAAANAPPPTQSSPSEPGFLDKAAAAAKAAVTGGDKKVAEAAAAAKALTGAADTAAGKIPALPTLPAPPADLVPIAPPMAVAAGGGISRKRSHPKYINQISENRNKIFKKELEIINSIRRFHRSHTIRKRDKINSILGFKKSKNNRNRNHGNTKRHHHKHRHNNHKHKSAKHIKK